MTTKTAATSTYPGNRTDFPISWVVRCAQKQEFTSTYPGSRTDYLPTTTTIYTPGIGQANADQYLWDVRGEIVTAYGIGILLNYSETVQAAQDIDNIILRVNQIELLGTLDFLLGLRNAMISELRDKKLA